MASNMSTPASSDNSSSSSGDDDDDDEDDNIGVGGCDKLTESRIEHDQLTKFNKTSNNDETTKPYRDTGSKHERRSHRRRLSSQQRLPSSLSRYKLSLPYILWFCQLLQLVGGLWPQQSFIAYSTLLLYSYAIYVILPMRLHSCILLAVGLSIVGPSMDYIFWLYLSASYTTHDNNYSTTTNPPTITSNEQDGYESQPTSDLLDRATTIGGYNRIGSSTNLHPLIHDSALLIPMTSQFSKVSKHRRKCITSVETLVILLTNYGSGPVLFVGWVTEFNSTLPLQNDR
jgi:hypothetical protein